MDSNKELLEFAAKAGGIQIDYSRFNGGGARNTGFDLSGNAVLDWHNYKTWNPLTDDGDALRLAVCLNLNVFHTDGNSYATNPDGEDDGFNVGHDGDKYAATRRAITCAAAEIGKAMLS